VSRHRVQIERKSWEDEEGREALAEEGFDIEGEPVDCGDYWAVLGHMTLVGGETEGEAHERLAGVLGSINTKWLNLEYLDWDEVIADVDWEDNPFAESS
jgi:hypothetical protein